MEDLHWVSPIQHALQSFQDLAEFKEAGVFHLEGVVEGIPEGMYPLPEGLGAVVAAGYDDERMAHPLVFLRGDLPTGLQADLLGFCLAAAAGAEYGKREPGGNGLIFVGTEAGPVRGPGAALLGALTVQR
ncbi:MULTISPECIES: hypothetical protein [unclassified Streptomyces]|uniref:hypothetical protein n=1 Tax=unclassified Streptomyces TaxID=2593676 RepID=UPI003404B0FF